MSITLWDCARTRRPGQRLSAVFWRPHITKIYEFFSQFYISPVPQGTYVLTSCILAADSLSQLNLVPRNSYAVVSSKRSKLIHSKINPKITTGCHMWSSAVQCCSWQYQNGSIAGGPLVTNSPEMTRSDYGPLALVVLHVEAHW